MADVRLAPGDLVGDDAVGVRLGARAGGRRDRDHGEAGEQVVAVVAEAEKVAAIDGVE
jgi:hypothetical protein